WRFLPDDFRIRTKMIERYGETIMPEGNTIQDWPVSYDELEPHYDRFEYVAGISGKAGNIKGQIQPGGNPLEGWRAREFPTPPLMREPTFEARTECEVTKVNLAPDGKTATGVTYVDASGEEWEQPADLVLICAYALFNVRLLLLSGIGKPYDFASGEGVVGRN